MGRSPCHRPAPGSGPDTCAWAAHHTGNGCLANDALIQAISQAPEWATPYRIADIIDTNSPDEAADVISGQATADHINQKYPPDSSAATD